MKTFATIMLAVGLLFATPAIAQTDPDTEMFERVERLTNLERVERLTKVIGNQIFDILFELMVIGEQDLNAALKELERRYDIIPPKLDPEGEEI